MDRRTQRYVLVLLLIAVTLVLYRSLGSNDRYARGAYHGGVRLDEGPGELDLNNIEPANSTLGVGQAEAPSAQRSDVKPECDADTSACPHSSAQS